MDYTNFEARAMSIEEPRWLESLKGAIGIAFGIGAKKFQHKDGDTYEGTTDFYDCVYWGADAEKVAAICKKGNRVILKGELKQEKWTDTNGSQRRKTVLKIKKAELAD